MTTQLDNICVFIGESVGSDRCFRAGIHLDKEGEDRVVHEAFRSKVGHDALPCLLAPLDGKVPSSDQVHSCRPDSKRVCEYLAFVISGSTLAQRDFEWTWRDL